MSGKYGGGGKKCLICDKTVFAGEQIYFEKGTYHQNCFRCLQCKKKMALSTAKKHEGDFYCTRCYNRNGWNHQTVKVKWTKKENVDGGEKKSAGSSKYGGGGQPCFVCKKTVYPAEATNFEKRVYHAKCFNCTTCQLLLKPSNAAAYKDKDYCRKCFATGGYNQAQTQTTKNWKSTGESSGGGSGKYGGGGTTCTVCTKKVYGAERLTFEKRNYHSACFKCAKCHKKCTTGNAAKYDDVDTGLRSIYCKKCFKEEGLAAQQAKVGKWVPKATSAGSSSGKFGGGGSKCKICAKTVYPAEAVAFEKQTYHPKCFACTDCDKKLKPSNASLYEIGIYCPKCWNTGGYKARQAASTKNWVASGETKDSGGSSKFGGGGQRCAHCSKTVYTAEAASYEKHIYHSKCTICTDCDTLTAIKNLNMYQEKLKCQKCWKTNNYKAKQAEDSKKAFAAKQAAGGTDTTTQTDSRFKNFGGGSSKCAGCEDVLYPAEALSFEKQSYHAKCFTCANTEAHDEPLKLTTSSASYKKDSKGAVTVYCDNCFTSLGLNRAELN